MPTAVTTPNGPVATVLTGGDANGPACIVLTSGVPECWGYNVVGQLGTGSTFDVSTPVEVSW
jgi:hypothetical protein